MNEQTPIVFVDGLFVSRRENSPEFVVANLSFRTEEFINWIKAHTNAKGYCNIDIKKSRKGSIYASLNEWQPSEQSVKDEKTEDKDIKVDDIPF